MTPDHVNPEAPWPHLEDLAARTAEAGKVLVQRLRDLSEYVRAPERWLAPAVASRDAPRQRRRRLARAR